MTRSELFWQLLLVASFIAASVSLLTTGLGLANYLPLALAWPLALAVQLGLFGLAWLIAVGKRQLRGLVIALYCLTMPFSVVFSYVMLQSELVASIRPLEAERALYDELRSRSGAVSAELERGLAEGEELAVRLASWLELERSTGWTTATCSTGDHPYLQSVCDRLQAKVESWEESFGRGYRQGPGEQLIYGQLAAELESLTRIQQRLGEAKSEWSSAQSVFDEGIDNRERLRRYDEALSTLPVGELEAVRSETVLLPQAPPYEEFARDDADRSERPVYAFEDLALVFDRGHDLDRSDYPTLFAFGLALFIDLFVLMVAIGAAVLEDSPFATSGAAGSAPIWSSSLRQQIEAWIDGSLLDPTPSLDQRRAFLGRLVDAFRFDQGNRAVLVPSDTEQSRFAYLLAQARAATPSAAGRGKEPAFVLEDWVYPALAQYLTQSG